MCDGYTATLRPATDDDIETLVKWDCDPELAWLMGYERRSPEESRARMSRLMGDRNSVVMCIVGPGEQVVGDIVLTEIAWRSGQAELTVRIGDRGNWGKGLGQQAVRQMLDHAFNRLGLSRVYLRVCADNLRAIKCYLKCGFRREGAIKRTLVEGQEMRTVVLMTVESCEVESTVIAS
jgi:RimJ/RimL family protein N-acetyltransferase